MYYGPERGERNSCKAARIIEIRQIRQTVASVISSRVPGSNSYALLFLLA